MHSKTLKVVKAIIVSLSVTSFSWASKLTFKSGACTFRHDVFSNFSVQIADGRVRVDIHVVNTLTNGLKGHVNFEIRRPRTKAYQSIFQHDINYCALLTGAQDTIYRRWFLSMLKTGNFARSCPIQTGYYYLRDWRLNENLVPTFLYLGDYRIGGSFYYGKRWKRSDKLLAECLVEALLH